MRDVVAAHAGGVMGDLNIVGRMVRRARVAPTPRVTQQALAVRLQMLGWDIDRFGVSKIERGARRVTDREVLLLAEALGISVAVLLPGVEGSRE
ncbi:MAG TPA: helix-turn-helix transcriptional regulator [Anaerolineae bacterium]|nr:helix-turn-helix transcriptional regulator [Anaerolineae bacterium]